MTEQTDKNFRKVNGSLIRLIPNKEHTERAVQARAYDREIKGLDVDVWVG